MLPVKSIRCGGWSVSERLNDIDERTRSEEAREIQRRAAEFAALYETSKELAAQRDLQGLLQTIIRSTDRLLNPTTVAIALYSPQQRDLELVAGHGSLLPVGARVPLGRGLLGYVALSREPLIVNDYRAWEHRLPELAAEDIAAGAAAPMLYGGELVGVLVISQNAAPPPTGSAAREFTEGEVRLLELFAAQAAGVVHNAQLLEEAEARAQQLALLYDAGLTLNRTLDPRTQLEFLFQIATRALHAERAEYWRYDGASEEARFELGVGLAGEVLDALDHLAFAKGEARGLVGLVAQTRLPIYLGDVATDPRYMPVDPEVRSGLWVPVERQNELLGVLSVLSTRAQAFSPQDERLLVLFANQAAVAIENARLFHQTERGLRRLAALNGIDKAITSSLDLNVTLDVFLDNVVRELNVDAADVLLLDGVSRTLDYAAGRGFRSGALQHTRLPVGEGYAGQAVLERRVVNIPDLASRRDGLRHTPLLGREGFVAYYAVPLICKGQVKGILEVFHRAPLNPDEEWSGFLETLAGQAAIAIDSVQMFDNLQRSNADLTLAYDITLEGWSHALDLRGKETEGHTRRVTELTLRLARIMGMNEADLVHVRRGALLHDIGKMGIPDSILLKPGPLTEAEWELMHKHPTCAVDLLSPIAYLRPALDIPGCHHEKWDGTGYPHGLAGEHIPLAARIFAVVDVWDALCSERPYRPAWSRVQAREYICEQAGKHFDPVVVERFLAML
jgi:putative nucleotidyltransferase with HDIG domain